MRLGAGELVEKILKLDDDIEECEYIAEAIMIEDGDFELGESLKDLANRWRMVRRCLDRQLTKLNKAKLEEKNDE